MLNIILKRHEIQTEAEMSQFVKSLLVKLRLVRGQQRSKCHAGILSLFVIAANQQPAMTINKLLENRNKFKIFPPNINSLGKGVHNSRYVVRVCYIPYVIAVFGRNIFFYSETHIPS